MLKNILIFRTDRIGDLLLTCPAIITLKNYFNNSKITLISSEKNYEYAKTLKLFDEIYKFPKSNIINKILLIAKLRAKKFDYVFVFDGKDRSLLSAIFIKSVNKIAVISEKKASLFWNLFKINITNNYKDGIVHLFEDSLKRNKINTRIENFNFLKNKNDNCFSANIKMSNYLHIHLDEKWIKSLYIRNYDEIDPNYDDFINFLNLLSKKFNILITTGLINFSLIDELKSKFFVKETDKIYIKKSVNNFIYLVYKPTFDDIESLLRNSKILITCHGAITQAANSFNVKIFDIINKDNSSWYLRYTSHLKNYKSIFRNKFNVIQHELLKKIFNE